MSSRLSLILPTYNEVENIKCMIEKISEVLKNIHEIIVVDDDSSDGTKNVVEELIKTGKLSYLRLESRHSDHGLTKSIARGIELSTGDLVGWMDCDLSMPPEYLPVFLSYMNIGYDAVVGSRFALGGKWGGEGKESILKIALSRLLNLFIQVCLDHRFKDYTSGFVIARKEIFDKVKLRGDYGEYFIDFIYHALKLKYRVIEVPYAWVPRKYGYSKTGTTIVENLKRGWKYVTTTLRLLAEK